MINLHHLVVKDGTHVVLVVMHLLVEADALCAHARDQLVDAIRLLLRSLICNVNNRKHFLNMVDLSQIILIVFEVARIVDDLLLEIALLGGLPVIAHLFLLVCISARGVQLIIDVIKWSSAERNDQLVAGVEHSDGLLLHVESAAVPAIR